MLRDIYPYLTLTLRVPAGVADEAAFLVSQQVAALGALAGDVLGRACNVFGLFLSDYAVSTARVTLDVVFQDAGDGIGA